jgi:integrase
MPRADGIGSREFASGRPAMRRPRRGSRRTGKVPRIDRSPLGAREAVRTRHYSIRTRKHTSALVRQCILFCGKHHPQNWGRGGLRLHLVPRGRTQSALLSLCREVLALPLGWVDEVGRARKPERLSAVFTREEVRTVLGHLRDGLGPMASLLYVSALRLMKCVRLRVKNVDLTRLQLTVRHSKGGKDRVTVLPQSPVGPLGRQLDRARAPARIRLARGLRRLPSAPNQPPSPLQVPFPDSSTHWSMVPQLSS